MRCRVKSLNERNPHPYLPSGKAGHSKGTARVNLEEGGDYVKSAWSLCPGLQTCYNGVYRGKQCREAELIPKAPPSTDCRLQLACMKTESLVTAGQLNGGEYVPGPCTHRPSTHPSRGYPKSLAQPPLAEGGAEGILGEEE